MKIFFNYSFSIVALLLVFASCGKKELKVSPVQNIQVEKKQSSAEQLKEIMRIWPGTYNNDKQIADITKQGKDVWRIDDSGEDGYLQLQSHYIKLNKPEIAEHVLYVEEYRDHTPEETYRQRIYTLSIDSAGVIKVKMWPFKDKKKYVGSWKDLSMLEHLTVEEISAYPDFCDLHVSKVGDRYSMKMNNEDCSFGDKVFNYGVMLSADMFSYRDKITQKSDGKIISTAADFAYHNLDKIQ